MGYTHYYGNVTVTDELAEDARAIIAAAAASGIRTWGPGGTGKPEVTGARIALVGDDGPNADIDVDDVALPFVLGEGDRGGFIKTRRLPYDQIVTAILVAAFLRTGQVPRSDGSFDEWGPGVALYEQACTPVPPRALEQLRESLDG